MYTRLLQPPKKSFFLFGPRATGKTTWLRKNFAEALWVDLLKPGEFLKYQRDPDLFRNTVMGQNKKWIVIDEIQRLPRLLDDVHSLIEEQKGKYHFSMTGSSARKLRQSGTNLLAGRAIRRDFFPLTAAELKDDFNLEKHLAFGMLPGIITQNDTSEKIDALEAYTLTYLKEEIQQEALVKNLGSFSRFLEVAAICNGQVLNVASLARDAGVSRPTVQGYFEVLKDTLVGFDLPGWQLKKRIKEAQHKKFYFFDTGVVRALRGTLRDSIAPEEKGFLLETLVLHELRAWMSIQNTGGQLMHWRTPSGNEIDFIWVCGRESFGVEVKSSTRWKPEYGAALKEFVRDKKISRGFGVYLGAETLKDGEITVLPYRKFLDAI